MTNARKYKDGKIMKVRKFEKRKLGFGYYGIQIPAPLADDWKEKMVYVRPSGNGILITEAGSDLFPQVKFQEEKEPEVKIPKSWVCAR